MNFQKTALFVSLYLVHAMFDGRGFVLIAIGIMEILATFPHLQDDIKVIRRYEGWYYTHLVYYYNIFYLETDWSRIRPLPSTNLKLALSLIKKVNILNPCPETRA